MKFVLLIYQPSPFDPRSLPEAEYRAISEAYAAIASTPHVTPGLPLGLPEHAVTAWLTTVVSRIALDMLRVRKRRQEDALDVEQGQPALQRQAGATLEEETMLAESVGLAIQVVLDRLEPVARVALVFHDCFGFGFDDIARILDCSSAAARQAASRARRRIAGPDAVTTKRSTRQRELVQAFYAASRDGNLQPLLDVLDPQVRLTVGSSSAADAVALDMRGAEAVARQARAGARQGAALVCIDGDAGLVVMAGARLVRALTFVVQGRRIVGIHVVNAPSRLARLELSLLADQWPPPADQESRNRLLDNGPQNRVDVRAPGR